MNEHLLQYIWQQQLFNREALTTSSGEPMNIIHPGTINHHQGPDFLHATLRIGNTRWVGNIELHVQSSHWQRHGHEKDELYNNVILHVVWEVDKDFPLRFPTLVLNNRVPKALLTRFSQLVDAAGFIPCHKMIQAVPSIIINKTLESCFAERLEVKAKEISNLLPSTNGSWAEVSWLMLAKQFGQPVNEFAFQELARSVSWNTIIRHRYNPLQVEALLFGQARVLYLKSPHSYIHTLQNEYRFLRKKLKLQPIHYPLKFLRMRPANFPTVRLAQLAALILREPSLFDRMITLNSKKQVYDFFDVKVGPYWQSHYRPNDEEKFKLKNPGKAFCHHLMINLVAPLKFCYGLMLNDDEEKLKAIKLICQLPPEDNRITRNFMQMGVNPVSAADSQAMIQLKQHYCNELACLRCAIGHTILKQD